MFSGTWLDDDTMPGWFKCDGNNGTVNLVDKFVRGGATSGAMGGSDDAVVVEHTHGIKKFELTHDIGLRTFNALDVRASWSPDYIQNTGVSGIGKNIPAHYVLLFIQRIS